MNLPFHRRYHWRIMSRNIRLVRKLWMTVAALLLFALIVQGESFMRTKIQLLTVNNAYLDLKADVYRVSNFGAPGWVRGTGEELDMEIALNTNGGLQ